MKLDWRLVLVMVLALGLMVGCTKDEDDPEVGTFSDLSTYMQENGLDLPAMVGAGWVQAASAIVDTNDYTIPGYTILDIRGADDFAAGHIAGAINTTLADILTAADANAAGANGYLVVCYTGQTAGQGAMALKLLGHTSTVLKWGMCGWNETFAGSWNSNAGHDNGNNAAGNANWVTTAAPTLLTYDDPAWETETLDPAAILVERVEATIAGGFKKVNGHGEGSVMAAPSNYQIVNFWPATDFVTFGHFDGALQMQPISLADDVTKAIDPSMETAIYCYTGQTSSMATFWLNVLGYDAVSILFGVNTLNYDELYDAGKPTWHGAENFGYVEG